MTPRNTWWMIIALLAVAVPGCSRGGADEGSPSEFSSVLEIDEVTPVRRAQIAESLELVGTLIPWRFATIVSEVDGVIDELPIYEKKIEYEIGGKKYTEEVTLDIGHEVKEGAVLVQIDGHEFQLALDAAVARLNLVEKELVNLNAWKRKEEVDQLQAAAEEAAAVLERAELDLDRADELGLENAISQSQCDALKMAHSTADAANRRAEAALALAKAGPTPEQKEVALAQVALEKAEVALRQDKLDKCTIYCPFDAVIADRYVGKGDRVTALPRVDIMQIIDPTILFAEIGVPEKYQRLVHVNDPAVVQARGVSQRVPGVVGLVNVKIDPETRTFRVRVGVKNDRLDPESDSGERIFRSGSYVRVTLTLESAPDALVVPFEAMTFDEGQAAVFVFRGDHVEKRRVKLGISSRSQYEVVEGLSEGEQVVAGNTSLLADGVPVRLKGDQP